MPFSPESECTATGTADRESQDHQKCRQLRELRRIFAEVSGIPTNIPPPPIDVGAKIALAAMIGAVNDVVTLLLKNTSELPAGLQSTLVGLMIGQHDEPLDDQHMLDFAGLISWAAVAINERKGRLPKMSKMRKAILPEPMRAVATRTLLQWCLAPLTVVLEGCSLSTLVRHASTAFLLIKRLLAHENFSKPDESLDQVLAVLDLIKGVMTQRMLVIKQAMPTDAGAPSDDVKISNGDDGAPAADARSVVQMSASSASNVPPSSTALATCQPPEPDKYVGCAYVGRHEMSCAGCGHVHLHRSYFVKLTVIDDDDEVLRFMLFVYAPMELLQAEFCRSRHVARVELHTEQGELIQPDSTPASLKLRNGSVVLAMETVVLAVWPTANADGRPPIESDALLLYWPKSRPLDEVLTALARKSGLPEELLSFSTDAFGIVAPGATLASFRPEDRTTEGLAAYSLTVSGIPAKVLCKLTMMEAKEETADAGEDVEAEEQAASQRTEEAEPEDAVEEMEDVVEELEEPAASPMTKPAQETAEQAPIEGGDANADDDNKTIELEDHDEAGSVNAGESTEVDSDVEGEQAVTKVEGVPEGAEPTHVPLPAVPIAAIQAGLKSLEVGVVPPLPQSFTFTPPDATFSFSMPSPPKPSARVGDHSIDAGAISAIPKAPLKPVPKRVKKPIPTRSTSPSLKAIPDTRKLLQCALDQSAPTSSALAQFSTPPTKFRTFTSARTRSAEPSSPTSRARTMTSPSPPSSPSSIDEDDMDASSAELINAMALKDMISALKQTFLDVEPHVSRLADGIAQLYRLRPDGFHVFVEGPLSDEYGEPEDTLFCVLARYGRPNALRRVIECVRSLLERDPYLDQAGRDGETPLMLACKRGNVACVEVLLESGASRCVRSDGLDALALGWMRAMHSATFDAEGRGEGAVFSCYDLIQKHDLAQNDAKIEVYDDASKLFKAVSTLTMCIQVCLGQSADVGGSPFDEEKVLDDIPSLRLFATILRSIVAELNAMDISPGFLDAKRHLFVSGALSTLQLLQNLIECEESRLCEQLQQATIAALGAEADATSSDEILARVERECFDALSELQESVTLHLNEAYEKVLDEELDIQDIVTKALTQVEFSEEQVRVQEEAVSAVESIKKVREIRRQAQAREAKRREREERRRAQQALEVEAREKERRVKAEAEAARAQSLEARVAKAERAKQQAAERAKAERAKKDAKKELKKEARRLVEQEKHAAALELVDLARARIEAALEREARADDDKENKRQQIEKLLIGDANAADAKVLAAARLKKLEERQTVKAAKAAKAPKPLSAWLGANAQPPASNTLSSAPKAAQPKVRVVRPVAASVAAPPAVPTVLPPAAVPRVPLPAAVPVVPPPAASSPTSALLELHAKTPPAAVPTVPPPAASSPTSALLELLAKTPRDLRSSTPLPDERRLWSPTPAGESLWQPTLASPAGQAKGICSPTTLNAASESANATVPCIDTLETVASAEGSVEATALLAAEYASTLPLRRLSTRRSLDLSAVSAEPNDATEIMIGAVDMPAAEPDRQTSERSTPPGQAGGGGGFKPEGDVEASRPPMAGSGGAPKRRSRRINQKRARRQHYQEVALSSVATNVAAVVLTDAQTFAAEDNEWKILTPLFLIKARAVLKLQARARGYLARRTWLASSLHARETIPSPEILAEIGHSRHNVCITRLVACRRIQRATRAAIERWNTAWRSSLSGPAHVPPARRGVLSRRGGECPMPAFVQVLESTPNLLVQLEQYVHRKAASSLQAPKVASALLHVLTALRAPLVFNQVTADAVSTEALPLALAAELGARGERLLAKCASVDELLCVFDEAICSEAIGMEADGSPSVLQLAFGGEQCTRTFCMCCGKSVAQSTEVFKVLNLGDLTKLLAPAPTAPHLSAVQAPTMLPSPILPSPMLPSPMLPTPMLPSPMLPTPMLPSAMLPSPMLPSPRMPSPMLQPQMTPVPIAPSEPPPPSPPPSPPDSPAQMTPYPPSPPRPLTTEGAAAICVDDLNGLEAPPPLDQSPPRSKGLHKHSPARIIHGSRVYTPVVSSPPARPRSPSSPLVMGPGGRGAGGHGARRQSSGRSGRGRTGATPRLAAPPPLTPRPLPPPLPPYMTVAAVTKSYSRTSSLSPYAPVFSFSPSPAPTPASPPLYTTGGSGGGISGREDSHDSRDDTRGTSNSKGDMIGGTAGKCQTVQGYGESAMLSWQEATWQEALEPPRLIIEFSSDDLPAAVISKPVVRVLSVAPVPTETAVSIREARRLLVDLSNARMLEIQHPKCDIRIRANLPRPPDVSSGSPVKRTPPNLTEAEFPTLTRSSVACAKKSAPEPKSRFSTDLAGGGVDGSERSIGANHDGLDWNSLPLVVLIGGPTVAAVDAMQEAFQSNFEGGLRLSTSDGATRVNVVRRLPSKTVYVGNLHFMTTVERLAAWLSSKGFAPRACKLFRHSDLFAHVEFHNVPTALAAIQALNGASFLGLALQVDVAEIGSRAQVEAVKGRMGEKLCRHADHSARPQLRSNGGATGLQIPSFGSSGPSGPRPAVTMGAEGDRFSRGSLPLYSSHHLPGFQNVAVPQQRPMPGIQHQVPSHHQQQVMTGFQPPPRSFLPGFQPPLAPQDPFVPVGTSPYGGAALPYCYPDALAVNDCVQSAYLAPVSRCPGAHGDGWAPRMAPYATAQPRPRIHPVSNGQPAAAYEIEQPLRPRRAATSWAAARKTRFAPRQLAAMTLQCAFRTLVAQKARAQRELERKIKKAVTLQAAARRMATQRSYKQARAANELQAAWQRKMVRKAARKVLHTLVGAKQAPLSTPAVLKGVPDAPLLTARASPACMPSPLALASPATTPASGSPPMRSVESSLVLDDLAGSMLPAPSMSSNSTGLTVAAPISAPNTASISAPNPTKMLGSSLFTGEILKFDFQEEATQAPLQSTAPKELDALMALLQMPSPRAAPLPMSLVALGSALIPSLQPRTSELLSLIETELKERRGRALSLTRPPGLRSLTDLLEAHAYDQPASITSPCCGAPVVRFRGFLRLGDAVVFSLPRGVHARIDRTLNLSGYKLDELASAGSLSELHSHLSGKHYLATSQPTTAVPPSARRKHSEHHAYELYAAVDGTGGAFVCDEHGVWRKAVGAYTCLVDEATVIEAATATASKLFYRLRAPIAAPLEGQAASEDATGAAAKALRLRG